MGTTRKTKSVKELLNAFELAQTAISALELVERFHDQMNKSTVYRILERLENEGTLHSFIGKDGLRWYAICKDGSHSGHLDTHPHFQCRDCGKTECLNLSIPIPEMTKYSIESASVLLVGRCGDCT
ncbi:MAG: transcriptional repressor [Bacteroidota bacterium]